MPCTYDFPDRGTCGHQAELDKLTRMLCDLMGQITACEPVPYEHSCSVDLDEEMLIWWKAHQAWDAERKRKVREGALAKLTNEERKALGL